MATVPPGQSLMEFPKKPLRLLWALRAPFQHRLFAEHLVEGRQQFFRGERLHQTADGEVGHREARRLAAGSWPPDR